MIYLELFIEFFKTGLFAIGGGLATLPFLSDMAERTAWFTASDLADMIAVSESTPGPIGINMATYVGFKTAGVAGAIVATLAEILPAFIIVMLVARVLRAFSTNKRVVAALDGLRPASLAMIAAAGIALARLSLINLPFNENDWFALIRWKELALGLILFFAIRKFTKLHPVVWIGFSALIGIALF